MTAGGDSDNGVVNIVGVGGNIDFALPVVAPADDGTIGFEGDTVCPAAGNGGVIIPSRNSCLIGSILSPAGERAIIFDRQAMIAAGRNNDKVISGWDTGLTITVTSPAEKGAVFFQR